MASLALRLDVLEWAARQAGESFDSVARSIAPKGRSLDSVLNGSLTPAQVQKFAKRTRVPFGLLFLQSPPETIRPAIPDLRQAKQPDPLSLDFFEVLEDAERKQLWYKEHLLSNGAEPLAFVGSAKPTDRAQDVALLIRKEIGLIEADRTACKNQDDYFRLLSRRAEGAGIVVLKNRIVKSNTRRPLSPREFRGFAMADDIAPLVFVNGKDWEIAHVFTLLHEIAHIWVGQSGVSDLAYRQGNSGLEIFCNRVAAEVLVPEDEFLRHFDQTQDLSVLAKRFRVSHLVVARRALDLKRIGSAAYDGIAALSANAKPPSEDESGGDSYKSYPIRSGRKLTTALVQSALSGGTMIRDAASLLNIRPQTVMTLAQRLNASE